MSIMNASKKLIACAALLIALFSASSTFAQGGRMMDTAAMRQRMEARIQKMKDDLKLTPVQADSMKAISMDMQGKRREIFMDQSMSREDKMAKMQPLTDAANKRIEAVLGADLFKKYQDWEAANRPQRGGGGGN
jgi:Spy/CpxP family protein refolding chaperone